MIQRIQTLWLFLAALFMLGIFYFPIYRFFPEGDITIGQNFIAIVLAGTSIALSLITIFMFKNRRRQIRLISFNVLCDLLLMIWLFYSIYKDMTDTERSVSGYYWIGLFLPLICIILLTMARIGIKKDEKLVRSMDRLR